MHVPDYSEVRPSAGLDDFVECYWTLATGRSRSEPRSVLPDGCVDLMLDRAWSGSPGPRIVGAMTRAQAIAATARHDIVAVRFRPGGARALLQLPVLELVDTSAPLGELVETDACLADQMHAATAADALGALDSYLLDRRASVSARDRVAARYARACARARWGTVAGLAHSLGVSRQHLRRQVLAAAGIGPKPLARIGRLRWLTEVLQRGERPDASTALAAGYFDQSHMANEFRALTGTTPTRYASSIFPRPG